MICIDTHMTTLISKKTLFIILVLALGTGFIAGLAGSIFFRAYANMLPLVREVRITESSTGTSDIVIRDPRRVIVEQNTQIAYVAERLRSTTAQFVTPRRANVAADILAPAEVLGQGVIITSDGWVVMPRATRLRPEDAIALVGNRTYAIEQSILDPISGLLFVKLQATNLTVLPFADRSSAIPGQSIYAITSYTRAIGERALANAYEYTGADRVSYVRSSEGLDTSLTLQDAFDDAYEGSALVTLNGDIVGILADNRRAVPASYVNAISKSIVRTGAIARPFLGVHYIQLAQTPGQALRPSLPAHGAYIAAPRSGVAIAATSPLAKEMTRGDVILSVEGQEINKDRDLQDIIREFRPGTEISITIQKEGQTKTLSVVLGEVK